MTTPVISSVSGIISTGQLLAITGLNMVAEDQSSWLPFFQSHTDASGFEGAGNLTSMGYDTAHDADWIIDTSIKLMGTKSRRTHSSGEIIHLPPTQPSHGAEFTIFGATDMGNASITTDVWFRMYLRVDESAGGGEWPHEYGGADNDFKIMGLWADGTRGFWMSLDVPTNSPPDTPAGIRLTPNNLGNSHSSGPTLVGNRWYCVELKAPLDSNNHIWQIYVDGAQVFNSDLGQGIGGFGGSQWYGFFTNWYSTTPTYDQLLWVDGLGVKNNGRVRPASIVEIGDSAIYASAHPKYQAPEFLSDVSNQITCDLTGLSGPVYWMWVTDNAGNRSAAFPLGVGGGEIQTLMGQAML